MLDIVSETFQILKNKKGLIHLFFILKLILVIIVGFFIYKKIVSYSQTNKNLFKSLTEINKKENNEVIYYKGNTIDKKEIIQFYKDIENEKKHLKQNKYYKDYNPH